MRSSVPFIAYSKQFTETTDIFGVAEISEMRLYLINWNPLNYRKNIRSKCYCTMYILISEYIKHIFVLKHPF